MEIDNKRRVRRSFHKRCIELEKHLNLVVFLTYRKSSNIRHPQKKVSPNFNWFLIQYRIKHTEQFFNSMSFPKP